MGYDCALKRFKGQGEVQLGHTSQKFKRTDQSCDIGYTLRGLAVRKTLLWLHLTRYFE